MNKSPNDQKASETQILKEALEGVKPIVDNLNKEAGGQAAKIRDLMDVAEILGRRTMALEQALITTMTRLNMLEQVFSNALQQGSDTGRADPTG